MDASPETGLPELENQAFVDWASGQWGICFQPGQAHGLIHGSPERALSRGVARDDAGNRYLVEKFSKSAVTHKAGIARILRDLRARGLTEVLAPLPGKDQCLLPGYQDACFQVTRFVDGSVLERPQWLASSEIGEAMAGFLIRMRRCAVGVPFPRFSLKAYIYRLFKDMAAHSPDRHIQYLPVLRCLEQGFMDAHDRLSVSFCHGDFHPLNVIWEGHDIKAVIDWEFTGIKPDLYDAANLAGCAGIEYPEGLAMPMLTAFMGALKTAGLICPLGWRWLPEYVLALRFAWLSEWLRKNDREMLDTEYRFMEILMANLDDLRNIWIEMAD